MSQPTRTRPSRDEALWMLTGLLLGVAIWLGTDNIAAGVGVGIALGFSFAAQERANPSRRDGEGRSHPGTA
ncbi:MAG TPA: hypothetical protein VMM13_12780 [Euzebya sp.]|nr:hypothetical protein [Euzebya sp.]